MELTHAKSEVTTGFCDSRCQTLLVSSVAEANDRQLFYSLSQHETKTWLSFFYC